MGLVDSIFSHERQGYYGEYGGAFIPEILRTTLDELIVVFDSARRDPAFWDEFLQVMRTYSCRPTPITHLENLSNEVGGAQIYLKREDLNHTGAHKANNVMGQGLLVRRMGKKTGNRRDGCRSARCGHRDDGGSARLAMHHLYGGCRC